MKKIILFLIILISAQSAFSIGALYARRANSANDAFPLWLKSYDADVTITDQMAVTHIDHVFANETDTQLEGLFLFPLPENAVVTELALWVNGQRIVGDVMESQQARNVYESIVRRRIDPALLEYMGDNIFRLNVFPIDPAGQAMSERRVEITYTELLPYDHGEVEYGFLMKSVEMSSKPVGRLSLALDLTSQHNFSGVKVPTHPAPGGAFITQITSRHYQVAYGDEGTHSEKDFLLRYSLESADFSMTHLTYSPDPANPMPFDEPGDDPYYLLWVTPPANVTDEQVINKNIVFVADISSSMAGTRMEQLRTALSDMVSMLNAEDRFNIIAFNTMTTPFENDLVPVSPGSISQAGDFISMLGESGLTNMEDALTEALGSSWTAGEMNAVVFLTDGEPTWPLGTSYASVKSRAAAANTGNVKIFTFGIGDAIESAFLKQLAIENNAFAAQITSDDSIRLVMDNFMDRISHPLIQDISINYSGIGKYDVFPRVIPSLYAGSQFSQIGRYRNQGNFNVAFSGTVGSGTMSLTQNMPFPNPAANQASIARMWASAKIDYLLEEIELTGAQSELVNGIKTLGIKYGIITPYTSMLVVEPPNNVPVEDKRIALSSKVELLGNAPNPFRSATTIRYQVPGLSSPQALTLRIYDAMGKLARVLVDEMTAGGNFSIQWNGLDDRGIAAKPGYYIAILKVGDVSRMIRMRMIK